MIVVFDTGVLGNLCHPKRTVAAVAEDRVRGLYDQHGDRLTIYVPEIADYELRRKLRHIGSTSSIARLDTLNNTFRYLAITTSVMRKAADLWAEARSAGMSTAPPVALDGDVILAAQALSVNGAVATTYRKHIERFVAVQDWGPPGPG